MVNLDCFIFRELNIQEFSKHLEIPDNIAVVLHKHWLKEYSNRAIMFYRMNYKRHLSREFRLFCRENSLSMKYFYEIDDFQDADINLEMWKNYCENNYSLIQHKQFYERIIDDFRSRKLLSNNRLNPLDFFDDSDDFSSIWEIKKELAKELWFNLNILLPTESEIQYLKSIPYQMYLKTDHWERVKAAMVLIRFARCFHCEESHYDDYAYNESDLQVHHIHYENLGHERYKDLLLLCERHHKYVHSQKNNLLV